ncbi:hypothetical protein BJY04DRAFT_218895 [Aspergillus karnatakaensis]|uniref:C2H2-type zinc finger protein n=1 Tax=Aspergillus karnatakaensis TaxID=1810916 RepID=UPI003CCD5DB0
MLFNRNHDRKTHEKLHSGEKKFVCKGCGRRFARSSNLKRHLRSEKGQRCCRLMPDEETVRSDVTTDPKITEIHGQEHNRNQSSTSSSSSEQSLAEHRAANTLTDIARAVPEAVEQHQSSVTGRLGTTSAMTLLPLDFPS